jgi:hypothetical protein
MSDLEERLRALLDESGIPQGGSEELAALLASLEAGYVDDVTPEPGPELAALLGGGGRAPTKGTPFRRRHRAAFTGMAALGVVLGTGWAAAANELPAPAQHWVAEFSQRFLPFDLPFPESSARGRVPDAPQGDRRARRLDEHDARPTPGEGGADEEGLPSRQQALQKAPPDVVDGDPAPDDGDDGAQPSVEEAPEGAVQEGQRDAGETSEAEETPDRTRESSETQETQETQETETQQTESSESTDSGAEPAGSTSSDAPEESPDD